MQSINVDAKLYHKNPKSKKTINISIICNKNVFWFVAGDVLPLFPNIFFNCFSNVGYHGFRKIFEAI